MYFLHRLLPDDDDNVLPYSDRLPCPASPPYPAADAQAAPAHAYASTQPAEGASPRTARTVDAESEP